MDPVNKWLTVIIGFMVALLIVISWKAGSGRYAFVVTNSATLQNHTVVYVLDTKDGSVMAKVTDENKLLSSTNRAYQDAKEVFRMPSLVRRY